MFPLAGVGGVEKLNGSVCRATAMTVPLRAPPSPQRCRGTQTGWQARPQSRSSDCPADEQRLQRGCRSHRPRSRQASRSPSGRCRWRRALHAKKPGSEGAVEKRRLDTIRATKLLGQKGRGPSADDENLAQGACQRAVRVGTNQARTTDRALDQFQPRVAVGLSSIVDRRPHNNVGEWGLGLDFRPLTETPLTRRGGTNGPTREERQPSSCVGEARRLARH